MRWNQWRKRCILACIGGTVFWGSMAGINTVSAVTAGYMADGGHINSTSNVILYQDANGTYELSDQSASKGKTDNSEAVGNVAAGNFPKPVRKQIMNHIIFRYIGKQQIHGRA